MEVLRFVGRKSEIDIPVYKTRATFAMLIDRYERLQLPLKRNGDATIVDFAKWQVLRRGDIVHLEVLKTNVLGIRVYDKEGLHKKSNVKLKLVYSSHEQKQRQEQKLKQQQKELKKARKAPNRAIDRIHWHRIVRAPSYREGTLEAFELAADVQQKLNRPSIRIALTQTEADNPYCLRANPKFGERFCNFQSIRIFLTTTEGRKYPINWSNRHVSTGSGFAKFVKGEGIKPGDVLILEVTEYGFLVHIFKTSEQSRENVIDVKPITEVVPMTIEEHRLII